MSLICSVLYFKNCSCKFNSTFVFLSCSREVSKPRLLIDGQWEFGGYRFTLREWILSLVPHIHLERLNRLKCSLVFICSLVCVRHKPTWIGINCSREILFTQCLSLLINIKLFSNSFNYLFVYIILLKNHIPRKCLIIVILDYLLLL